MKDMLLTICVVSSELVDALFLKQGMLFTAHGLAARLTERFRPMLNVAQ